MDGGMITPARPRWLQRGGEGRRVAVPDHGRDQDGADREGGGHAGAGHGREDHAGQHAGAGQAALDAAHQALGELDHAFGNAAGFHQVAGQDEEGNRHQRVLVQRGVAAGPPPARAGWRRRPRQAGQSDRHGDRHGQPEENQHRDNHQLGHGVICLDSLRTGQPCASLRKGPRLLRRRTSGPARRWRPAWRRPGWPGRSRRSRCPGWARSGNARARSSGRRSRPRSPGSRRRSGRSTPPAPGGARRQQVAQQFDADHGAVAEARPRPAARSR